MHPRLALIAAFSLLPAAVSAQAFRCTDPASGQVLYTDQPCAGAALVVPKRSEAERQQDAANAAIARERERERAERQDERALQHEALRTQRDLARPPVAAAESEACRRARAEASFRAASFAASQEEIRTARYNAALACGQQPPADIVVVEPPAPAWPVQRPRGPWVDRPPPGFGGGDGLGAPHRPARPRYEPGTEPIPVKVR